MKISKYLALGFLIINLTPVWGQQGQNYTTLTINDSQQSTSETTNLTKFNLDFPGGTPEELVKAIEKGTGKPLNVIIPDENADMKLPPLKLNEVTFPQLSATLQQGSSKQVFSHDLNGRIFGFEVGYYFRTSEDGPNTDNSIWFFHAQNPPPESVQPPLQKICKFYSLEPYLNRGFTVDDITTAIQTGWKMAGITSPPELNYHKETKLLIAFCEQSQLQTIQDVLNTLPGESPRYDVDRMNAEINNLQVNFNTLNKEVGELNKKIPTQNSSSEEKSGK